MLFVALGLVGCGAGAPAGLAPPPSCMDDAWFVDQLDEERALLVRRGAMPWVVPRASLGGAREGDAVGDAGCGPRLRTFVSRQRSRLVKDVRYPLRL